MTKAPSFSEIELPHPEHLFSNRNRCNPLEQDCKGTYDINPDGIYDLKDMY